MILAVSLVTLLFASDASCQTVVTYSSKLSEELLCPITDQTITATWTDETTGNSLASYVRGGQPDIEIVDPGSKHNNFIYYVNGTSFSIFIQDVQAEDGGDYGCNTVGGGGTRNEYTVIVEVIPGTFSLACFVPPDVPCSEQGVNSTSELNCTCAANGVHPGTLYLDIPDAYNVQQNESIENGTFFDLRLKATVPVTESIAEVTCRVKGYNTTEPIPLELITTTFMISPPMCSLDISFDQECKLATLTCFCTASPTDGESPSDNGMVYSYFNGTGHIIVSGTTTTVQTNDVESGAVNTYSCIGCNGLYYGDASYVTESSECTISTTAPLSTNEPTSTKAMGTTTVEPESKSTDNPESGGLTTGAIVGISLGALAVVIVIVVIALMMFKPGKCGSKSDRSNIGNGIVNDGMEIPPPIYAEMKKKSDKPDDNGAGPGVDPEIPAYGVIDKNTTKDPTPAPLNSMRDTTNSSKPEQPMEIHDAVIDHGNEPPSNEENKRKSQRSKQQSSLL